MSFPQEIERMNREHTAWQAVVREYERKNPGTDFNDSALYSLVRAIEWWGEELVALRINQDAETRDKARVQRREAYTKTYPQH